MEMMDAVRIRIRHYMNERNLTLTALAMLCGLTQSTLENIMASRYQSTNISTIKKICDGLEIDLSDFFSEDLFSDLEPVGVKKKENAEG